ncbi:MAG: DUF3887 domain-containing protein [Emergencia sp.]
MKKKYLIIPAALALLAGVYAGGSELPEGFEKNRVFKTAKAFIRKFNQQDYLSCRAMFNADLCITMADDRLEKTFGPVRESMGKFIRIKGISATSKKLAGDDYVVCIVKCQYEYSEPDFIITLNQHMQICGLSIE